MLYWLTHLLQGQYHAFRVFHYLTFRSILAALTALLVGLLCGPIMIRWLQTMQLGQVVRIDGPQTHLAKSGTPTMGGVLILLGITSSSLLWGDLRQPALWLALFVTLGFGTVGWIDDYRKVVRKNSQGLPAAWKYFWQSVLALLAILALYSADSLGLKTDPMVPFLKNTWIPLGFLFPVFAYFVLVGSSNAVN